MLSASSMQNLTLLAICSKCADMVLLFTFDHQYGSIYVFIAKQGRVHQKTDFWWYLDGWRQQSRCIPASSWGKIRHTVTMRQAQTMCSTQISLQVDFGQLLLSVQWKNLLSIPTCLSSDSRGSHIFLDRMEFNFSLFKCFTEHCCVSYLLLEHPVVQGMQLHQISLLGTPCNQGWCVVLCSEKTQKSQVHKVTQDNNNINHNPLTYSGIKYKFSVYIAHVE